MTLADQQRAVLEDQIAEAEARIAQWREIVGKGESELQELRVQSLKAQKAINDYSVELRRQQELARKDLARLAAEERRVRQASPSARRGLEKSEMQLQALLERKAVFDRLCISCSQRERHFGDLCKRCADEQGVRPVGKVA